MLVWGLVLEWGEGGVSIEDVVRVGGDFGVGG